MLGYYGIDRRLRLQYYRVNDIFWNILFSFTIKKKKKPLRTFLNFFVLHSLSLWPGVNNIIINVKKKKKSTFHSDFERRDNDIKITLPVRWSRSICIDWAFGEHSDRPNSARWRTRGIRATAADVWRTGANTTASKVNSDISGGKTKTTSIARR